jgi:hypothetical protein
VLGNPAGVWMMIDVALRGNHPTPAPPHQGEGNLDGAPPHQAESELQGNRPHHGEGE